MSARGAGLSVPATASTAEALERLVSDPALMQASQEVAAEIATMPAPTDVVEPQLPVAR